MCEANYESKYVRVEPGANANETLSIYLNTHPDVDIRVITRVKTDDPDHGPFDGWKIDYIP